MSDEAVRFLDAAALPEQVRGLLRDGRNVKVAVPFWGGTAFDHLGVEAGRLGKVVCNLESGACCPDTIRMLPREGVRSSARLHAKIYWTKGGAIVGSANASANGLSLEGRELDGWDEAGAFLPSGSAAHRAAGEEVDRLFEGARAVTDEMLAVADEAWAKRRRNRPEAISGDVPIASLPIMSFVDVLRMQAPSYEGHRFYLLVEEGGGELEDDDQRDGYVRSHLPEIDVADNSGSDEWVGHVPLGMNALCASSDDGGETFSTYWSCTFPGEGAHTEGRNGNCTYAVIPDGLNVFARRFGVRIRNSFRRGPTRDFLSHLWQKRGNIQGNIYNQTSEDGLDYEAVLITFEQAAKLLKAFAPSP